MRTELEKQLAIFTLKNELVNAPKMNFFGDNNHESIRLSIELIEGKITIDDVYHMEEDEVITEGELSSVLGYDEWLNGDEELVELLFDESSLVTELPAVSTGTINICSKTCGECPFSNKSIPGWLAEYQPKDLNNFMNGEVSFPCHMTMKNGDMSPQETQDAIASGELRMCRGYVESMIKSCKSPYRNKQLVAAIELVREQGLSDNTMSMNDFFEHHSKYKK